MNGQCQPLSCDHAIRAHKLCLALTDIMMPINFSHDTDEIFHKVVDESCKALGFESARIAMREGDNWVIRYVSNLPYELIGRSFTDEELPHAALAMTTRKPVAIDDAFHDDRTNTQMMESLGIKSVLVFPLMEKDVVTGTMMFGYHSGAVSFSDAEIDYAERMTTGIAIAIQNARLHQELNESKMLGDALSEIDNILYSTQDYDVIMNKMLQLATDAIGAESAVIFSKEGDRWIVRNEYKLPVSLCGQSFSNTEVMHTAVTAITKRSLVVQDVLNSPDVDKKFVEMLGIRSLLDFPLILKGEVIGDLTFHYHSSPVQFNERQVEFVRKLQIAIPLALENTRLLNTYKQSESKLKEAEKLGKFGHFNYDVPTRKTTWSEGVFNIFGRDPALGEPSVEEFFEQHPVDPGLEAMQELVGSNEISEFDAKIQRGDITSFFHFSIRSAKDDQGDIVTFFGTIQDITERKQAEEEHDRLLLQLEAVLENINIGVVIFDLEGNILKMNPSALAIHGYESFEQVQLQRHQYQDIFELSDLDGHPVPFDQWPVSRALRGERFADYEVRVLRKNTGKSWVCSYSGTPVHTTPGNIIILVVNTMRDITERKFAEEEIRRLNVGLTEWVTELDIANKDLKAFNYTVAHDLRNPLNVISLSCQAIKELCGDQLPEECLDYVKDANNGVEHMNHLIEALLNFSLMGRVELHREKVSLRVLAQEVARILKKSEPARHVDFRISDRITADADADANLMRVVLDNLLGNAWKYTGKQEKTIIEFGTTDIDGKEVYFVRDNGAGFEKAASDKLFKPFERLPGAEEFKGSGIGLATVERIIQRHGGRIWAEGEPGKGATFYFTLSAD